MGLSDDSDYEERSGKRQKKKKRKLSVSPLSGVVNGNGQMCTSRGAGVAVPYRF